MFKTILKIGFVILAAAILTVGMHKCMNDFICNAAEVSDWKECGTKLFVFNSNPNAVQYEVMWLDHDVPEFGKAMPRCGGELQGYSAGRFSENFKLYPGRHVVTWLVAYTSTVLNQYQFVVTPNTYQVLITPKKAIVLERTTPAAVNIEASALLLNCSYLSVPDIQRELREEVIVNDIKQAVKDIFIIFEQRAKVTKYGQIVLLHTSHQKNNILYTMSIRSNKYGIVSIDFTKQVTISKDTISIYYEGVKANGYYCYAKQLLKAENCKQIKIAPVSVFNQVIVMLFKGGDIC